MSFFKSWRSHYTVGYLLGLAWRRLGDDIVHGSIVDLDRWAYQREWRQNLKSNHPNAELSTHQLREAMAWGAGARKATGIDVPYPSPPYRPGAKWHS